MEFLNNVDVLIMFASPYSMQDEETKTTREGLSVEYYFYGKDGEALRPVADAGEGALGIRRSKCSMDIDMKDKLSYVPGIYNGSFEMRVGSDGKPVLKLKEIDFVGRCNILLDTLPGDAPADAPLDAPVEENKKIKK